MFRESFHIMLPSWDKWKYPGILLNMYWEFLDYELSKTFDDISLSSTCWKAGGRVWTGAKGKATDFLVPSLYNMHTFSWENYLKTSADSKRSFSGVLFSHSLITLTFFMVKKKKKALDLQKRPSIISTLSRAFQEWRKHMFNSNEALFQQRTQWIIENILFMGYKCRIKQQVAVTLHKFVTLNSLCSFWNGIICHFSRKPSPTDNPSTTTTLLLCRQIPMYISIYNRIVLYLPYCFVHILKFTY